MQFNHGKEESGLVSNYSKVLLSSQPQRNKGSSSEGVKWAKSEIRPTLKTSVIDGWVKGWSLLNPLSLEGGYGPDVYMNKVNLSDVDIWGNIHVSDNVAILNLP